MRLYTLCTFSVMYMSCVLDLSPSVLTQKATVSVEYHVIITSSSCEVIMSWASQAYIVSSALGMVLNVHCMCVVVSCMVHTMLTCM